MSDVIRIKGDKISGSGIYVAGLVGINFNGFNYLSCTSTDSWNLFKCANSPVQQVGQTHFSKMMLLVLISHHV